MSMISIVNCLFIVFVNIMLILVTIKYLLQLVLKDNKSKTAKTILFQSMFSNFSFEVVSHYLLTCFHSLSPGHGMHPPGFLPSKTHTLSKVDNLKYNR